jgi:hypothetical protein
MPEDLLIGPLRPRDYRGDGWRWLCWDGLVTVTQLAGADLAAAATSLDGGATLVPMSAVGDRPIANLRLSPAPPDDALRVVGEIVARGRGPRHGRTLLPEAVERWTGPDGLAVEASTSEMLFRCDNPPTGAAWRLYLQKRWLAIAHLAVAPAGQIESAGNLLAGGLDGGAAPRLETLAAAHSIRSSGGTFATTAGQVTYRAQLGPLDLRMTLDIRPDGLTAGFAREALDDCLAFDAPALAMALEEGVSVTRDGLTLRLGVPGAAAVLTAEPPLRWLVAADGRTVRLLFNDYRNDLGLLRIQTGRTAGRVDLRFETR